MKHKRYSAFLVGVLGVGLAGLLIGGEAVRVSSWSGDGALEVVTPDGYAVGSFVTSEDGSTGSFVPFFDPSGDAARMRRSAEHEQREMSDYSLVAFSFLAPLSLPEELEIRWSDGEKTRVTSLQSGLLRPGTWHRFYVPVQEGRVDEQLSRRRRASADQPLEIHVRRGSTRRTDTPFFVIDGLLVDDLPSPMRRGREVEWGPLQPELSYNIEFAEAVDGEWEKVGVLYPSGRVETMGDPIMPGKATGFYRLSHDAVVVLADEDASAWAGYQPMSEDSMTIYDLVEIGDYTISFVEPVESIGMDGDYYVFDVDNGGIELYFHAYDTTVLLSDLRVAFKVNRHDKYDIKDASFEWSGEKVFDLSFLSVSLSDVSLSFTESYGISGGLSLGVVAHEGEVMPSVWLCNDVSGAIDVAFNNAQSWDSADVVWDFSGVENINLELRNENGEVAGAFRDGVLAADGTLSGTMSLEKTLYRELGNTTLALTDLSFGFILNARAEKPFVFTSGTGAGWIGNGGNRMGLAVSYAAEDQALRFVGDGEFLAELGGAELRLDLDEFTVVYDFERAFVESASGSAWLGRGEDFIAFDVGYSDAAQAIELEGTGAFRTELAGGDLALSLTNLVVTYDFNEVKVVSGTGAGVYGKDGSFIGLTATYSGADEALRLVGTGEFKTALGGADLALDLADFSVLYDFEKFVVESASGSARLGRDEDFIALDVSYSGAAKAILLSGTGALRSELAGADLALDLTNLLISYDFSEVKVLSGAGSAYYGKEGQSIELAVTYAGEESALRLSGSGEFLAELGGADLALNLTDFSVLYDFEKFVVEGAAGSAWLGVGENYVELLVGYSAEEKAITLSGSGAFTTELAGAELALDLEDLVVAYDFSKVQVLSGSGSAFFGRDGQFIELEVTYSALDRALRLDGDGLFVTEFAGANLELDLDAFEVLYNFERVILENAEGSARLLSGANEIELTLSYSEETKAILLGGSGVYARPFAGANLELTLVDLAILYDFEQVTVLGGTGSGFFGKDGSFINLTVNYSDEARMLRLSGDGQFLSSFGSAELALTFGAFVALYDFDRFYIENAVGSGTLGQGGNVVSLTMTYSDAAKAIALSGQGSFSADIGAGELSLTLDAFNALYDFSRFVVTDAEGSASYGQGANYLALDVSYSEMAGTLLLSGIGEFHTDINGAPVVLDLAAFDALYDFRTFRVAKVAGSATLGSGARQLVVSLGYDDAEKAIAVKGAGHLRTPVGGGELNLTLSDFDALYDFDTFTVRGVTGSGYLGMGGDYVALLASYDHDDAQIVLVGEGAFRSELAGADLVLNLTDLTVTYDFNEVKVVSGEGNGYFGRDGQFIQLTVTYSDAAQALRLEGDGEFITQLGGADLALNLSEFVVLYDFDRVVVEDASGSGRLGRGNDFIALEVSYSDPEKAIVLEGTGEFRTELAGADLALNLEDLTVTYDFNEVKVVSGSGNGYFGRDGQFIQLAVTYSDAAQALRLEGDGEFITQLGGADLALDLETFVVLYDFDRVFVEDASGSGRLGRGNDYIALDVSYSDAEGAIILSGTGEFRTELAGADLAMELTNLVIAYDFDRVRVLSGSGYAMLGREGDFAGAGAPYADTTDGFEEYAGSPIFENLGEGGWASWWRGCQQWAGDVFLNTENPIAGTRDVGLWSGGVGNSTALRRAFTTVADDEDYTVSWKWKTGYDVADGGAAGFYIRAGDGVNYWDGQRLAFWVDGENGHVQWWDGENHATTLGRGDAFDVYSFAVTLNPVTRAYSFTARNETKEWEETHAGVWTAGRPGDALGSVAFRANTPPGANAYLDDVAIARVAGAEPEDGSEYFIRLDVDYSDAAQMLSLTGHGRFRSMLGGAELELNLNDFAALYDFERFYVDRAEGGGRLGRGDDFVSLDVSYSDEAKAMLLEGEGAYRASVAGADLALDLTRLAVLWDFKKATVLEGEGSGFFGKDEHFISLDVAYSDESRMLRLWGDGQFRTELGGANLELDLDAFEVLYDFERLFVNNAEGSATLASGANEISFDLSYSDEARAIRLEGSGIYGRELAGASLELTLEDLVVLYDFDRVRVLGGSGSGFFGTDASFIELDVDYSDEARMLSFSGSGQFRSSFGGADLALDLSAFEVLYDFERLTIENAAGSGSLGRGDDYIAFAVSYSDEAKAIALSGDGSYGMSVGGAELVLTLGVFEALYDFERFVVTDAAGSARYGKGANYINLDVSYAKAAQAIRFDGQGTMRTELKGAPLVLNLAEFAALYDFESFRVLQAAGNARLGEGDRYVALDVGYDGLAKALTLAGDGRLRAQVGGGELDLEVSAFDALYDFERFVVRNVSGSGWFGQGDNHLMLVASYSRADGAIRLLGDGALRTMLGEAELSMDLKNLELLYDFESLRVLDASGEARLGLGEDRLVLTVDYSDELKSITLIGSGDYRTMLGGAELSLTLTEVDVAYDFENVVVRNVEGGGRLGNDDAEIELSVVFNESHQAIALEGHGDVMAKLGGTDLLLSMDNLAVLYDFQRVSIQNAQGTAWLGRGENSVEFTVGYSEAAQAISFTGEGEFTTAIGGARLDLSFDNLALTYDFENVTVLSAAGAARFGNGDDYIDLVMSYSDEAQAIRLLGAGAVGARLGGAELLLNLDEIDLLYDFQRVTVLDAAGSARFGREGQYVNMTVGYSDAEGMMILAGDGEFNTLLGGTSLGLSVTNFVVAYDFDRARVLSAEGAGRFGQGENYIALDVGYNEAAQALSLSGEGLFRCPLGGAELLLDLSVFELLYDFDRVTVVDALGSGSLGRDGDFVAVEVGYSDAQRALMISGEGAFSTRMGGAELALNLTNLVVSYDFERVRVHSAGGDGFLGAGENRMEVAVTYSDVERALLVSGTGSFAAEMGGTTLQLTLDDFTAAYDFESVRVLSALGSGFAGRGENRMEVTVGYSDALKALTISGEGQFATMIGGAELAVTLDPFEAAYDFERVTVLEALGSGTFGLGENRMEVTVGYSDALKALTVSGNGVFVTQIGGVDARLDLQEFVAAYDFNEVRVLNASGEGRVGKGENTMRVAVLYDSREEAMQLLGFGELSAELGGAELSLALTQFEALYDFERVTVRNAAGSGSFGLGENRIDLAVSYDADERAILLDGTGTLKASFGGAAELELNLTDLALLYNFESVAVRSAAGNGSIGRDGNYLAVGVDYSAAARAMMLYGQGAFEVGFGQAKLALDLNEFVALYDFDNVTVLDVVGGGYLGNENAQIEVAIGYSAEAGEMTLSGQGNVGVDLGMAELLLSLDTFEALYDFDNVTVLNVEGGGTIGDGENYLSLVLDYSSGEQMIALEGDGSLGFAVGGAEARLTISEFAALYDFESIRLLSVDGSGEIGEGDNQISLGVAYSADENAIALSGNGSLRVDTGGFGFGLSADVFEGLYDFETFRVESFAGSGTIYKDAELIALAQLQLVESNLLRGAFSAQGTPVFGSGGFTLQVDAFDVAGSYSFDDGSFELENGNALFTVSGIAGASGSFTMMAAFNDESISAGLAGEGFGLTVCGATLSNPSLGIQLTRDLELIYVEGEVDAAFAALNTTFTDVGFRVEEGELVRFAIGYAEVVYQGFDFSLSNAEYTSTTGLSFDSYLAIGGLGDLDVQSFTVGLDGVVRIGRIEGNINRDPVHVHFSAEFDVNRFTGWFEGTFPPNIEIEGAVDVGARTDPQGRYVFVYLFLDTDVIPPGIVLGPSGILLTSIAGELGINYKAPAIPPPAIGDPERGTHSIGLGLGLGDVAGLMELSGFARLQWGPESTSMFLVGELEVTRTTGRYFWGQLTVDYTFGENRVSGTLASEITIPPSGSILYLESLINYSVDSGEWFVVGDAAGKLFNTTNITVWGKVNLRAPMDDPFWGMRGQLGAGLDASYSGELAYPSGFDPTSCRTAQQTDNWLGFGFRGYYHVYGGGEIMVFLYDDGITGRFSVYAGFNGSVHTKWPCGLFGCGDNCVSVYTLSAAGSLTAEQNAQRRMHVYGYLVFSSGGEAEEATLDFVW